jgi:hypothetical protein
MIVLYAYLAAGILTCLWVIYGMPKTEPIPPPTILDKLAAILVLMLLWPVCLWAELESKRQRPKPVEYQIDISHMLRPLSISEIEQKEPPDDPSAPALPFGFLNPEWLDFRKDLTADAELWEFAGALEDLLPCYVEGYALVVDNTVSRYFSTVFSVDSVPAGALVTTMPPLVEVKDSIQQA